MDRNTVIATVLIGLIMVVWLYWMAPQNVPPPEQPVLGEVDTTGAPDGIVEEAPALRRPAAPLVATMDSSLVGSLDGEEEFVTVDTDLYEAVFSTRGATLKSFLLKKYERADHGAAVQLVDTAGSGSIALVFTTPASHSVDTRQLYFTATGPDRIDATQSERTLTFEARLGAGVLRQTYTFKPKTYEVGLTVEKENPEAFSTHQGYDLLWDGGVPFAEEDAKSEGTRTGAFVRSGGEVEEINLNSEAYEEKSLRGQIDWVAVKNQYFTAALIPSTEAEGAELIGERTAEPGEPGYWEEYEVSLQMPPSAGADAYRLYLGPLEYYRLSKYDLGLYGMVDYGYDLFEWMTRPLAKFVFIPIFSFLGNWLPNYGIVIVVLAILMKIVLFPLTKASYRSMAKMRDLQPQMEAIKEKHADNPQKQQEAMMKMYKETGVNPLGGCLPMLLQYPVIIALWQFLPQSIEIRQKGFLWAADLSAPDKILQLPFEIPLYGDFVAGFTLLMGISMVVQMRIQMASTPSNPQTKIFTYVMPIMIFAIFNRFASGLSLYYLCYNVFTAIQQKFINKSIEREKEAGKNGKGTKRDARKAAKAKGKGGKRSAGKQRVRK
ncbi:MAG: membrane protein insertase YidC [Rhodothermales bacterium]|nr:membrane protein insertase YidC [Rhodothermales bacterium]